MSIVVRAFCHSGGLKAGDAVGDRLGAGHGGAAVGERAHEEEQPEGLGRDVGRDDAGHLRRLAEQRAEHAEAEHQQRAAEEDVGRGGEDRAALADAAQVHGHDDQDREDDDRHRDRRENREGRIEGLDACRHADRDGQDVVRQQRRGRDQARQDAQVRVGDDVAAAAVRVRADGLPVGERDEREDANDREGDRQQPAEGLGEPTAEQGEQARLRGVGHRRHDVGGEDRQRLPFRAVARRAPPRSRADGRRGPGESWRAHGPTVSWARPLPALR